MIVKEIDFKTLKDYWIEVGHFHPDQNIPELVKNLGHHRTIYDNPERISYGLYDNNYLIGGTQLVRWNEDRIRYRTINIRKEYRGQGLGWFLLVSAYNLHWKGKGNLFGWIKDTHYTWALNHGFVDIDNNWSNNHIGMERIMNDK